MDRELFGAGTKGGYRSPAIVEWLEELKLELDPNINLVAASSYSTPPRGVVAELVDVVNDRQLWGDRYTGDLDDILATEEEIATRVSEALRLELTGQDQARLAQRHTSSAEAHRLYLNGRFHLDKRDKAGIGTVVATMLPYSVAFFIVWTVLLIVWFLLDLPVGPGAPLKLPVAG